MKIYLELMTLLLTSWYENSEAQTSIFDAFLPQWKIAKDVFLNVLTPPSKNPRNLRLADELHKLQPRVSDDTLFPCALNNTRSNKRPNSVHELRPGDIDVIGVIGDSLSAGNGLAATNLLHVGIENRGISFSGGGQGTWREFVTLPNILKEFNPQLIGYSLQDSFGHHAAAQFNSAEPGAMSRDMPFVTKILIKRMKDDPRVNITEDWKMVSFMIGSNDFCSDMCYRKDPESIIKDHRKNLLKVLRMLRDNLPRTIVNIIVTPDLKPLFNAPLSNRPPLCYFTHNVLCPCLFGLQFQRSLGKFTDILLKWQQLEIELGSDPEFDREDFTVVVQPFAFHYKLHTTKEGLLDYSALSQDCFHLSQKEGARAAISLWNNILEPIGRKTTHPIELFDFKCPENDHPFIFTRRNS